jgi:hypothetical protein
MKRTVVLAVALALASVGIAMAGQQRSYRLSDQQLSTLVKRIDTRTKNFRASLKGAIDRGQINDSRGKNEVNQSVKDFGQSIDRLRDRVDHRQSGVRDVEDVLQRGASIDSVMHRYQLSTQAERDWVSLRGDLDSLAGAYNVAWNWSNPRYASAEPGTVLYNRLTGTYQLQSTGGDDPGRVAELAARAAPSNQRQWVYQNLLTRLESPDVITIARHGNTVTMASTLAPPVSFEVDGRNRSERWSGDRTITTRAIFEGERLVVTTTGNRDTDFIASFDPNENGRSLLVTRTIYDQGLRQPVTVRSFYQRTSDQARWDIDAGDGRAVYDTRWSDGDSVVPDGTRFVARLDNALSTTNAREGDRWTMTAQSPSQYQGAVIEGFVSGVNTSGRPAGSSDMTLNLQLIRLLNGGTYQFDGVIDSIRTPDGEMISVGRAGVVENRDGRDDNQTRETIQGGAIGAAIGALIGSVAGGGKGAAIGAVIGASVGAGTAMVQGRDRLDLQRGTELAITAGIPQYWRGTPSAQR